MADDPTTVTMPAFDTAQFDRLMDALIQGLVPEDRQVEADAIKDAIAAHMIAGWTQLYIAGYVAGHRLGIAKQRAQQQIDAVVQDLHALDPPVMH